MYVSFTFTLSPKRGFRSLKHRRSLSAYTLVAEKYFGLTNYQHIVLNLYTDGSHRPYKDRQVSGCCSMRCQFLLSLSLGQVRPSVRVCQNPRLLNKRPEALIISFLLCGICTPYTTSFGAFILWFVLANDLGQGRILKLKRTFTIKMQLFLPITS